MPALLKKIIIAILAVAGLLTGVYFLQKSAPDYLQTIEPRTGLKTLPMAPDFELADLNGQRVKLSDWRGRKIILSFWTSWNQSSIEQIKILNDYQKLPQFKETVILAINSLEQKTAVEAIKQKENIDLTVLLDQNGEAGEIYNIGVLPLTVIIDKGGQELERIIGPATIQEIEN